MRPVPIALHSRAAAVDRRRLRAIVSTCLDRERVPPEVGVSVVLAGDRLVRRLNREWRGLDRTTDVLSFPLEDPPLPPEARGQMPALIGEVVISLPQCLAQAEAQGVELGAELARLLVHGLLHCLGYDHERPSDRRKMLPRERALRAAARSVGVVQLLRGAGRARAKGR